LYFVIEEKNNQVELTDNGIKFLSGDTDSDFCSSRYRNWYYRKKIRKDAELRKRKIIPRF
jgi:preprotein translocase subunit SecA